MKSLNKMRLMIGVPIDPSIEGKDTKPITEARAVPLRKAELKTKDEKVLGKGVANIQSAIKHIEQAVKSLDKIDATDFSGDVPRFIQELEDLVDEDGHGMKSYLEMCETGLRKHKREDNAAKRAAVEAEEAMDDEVGAVSDYDDSMAESTTDEQDGKRWKQTSADPADATQKYGEENVRVTKGGLNSGDDMVEVFVESDENIEESMMMFNQSFKNHEDDEEKPINVSDGSSNDEQVYKALDPKNRKKEAPSQLRTGDEKSEQDQSDGLDVETEFKTPAAIMKSLQTAINDAKAEAKKMDTSNKDSAQFFNDLAKAFEDLKEHLDKKTQYDFKMAQHFAQSLMGPMIHKLPADVWKFLTNGGVTRSLKDYMKPVKDYIEGPRNTIK